MFRPVVYYQDDPRWRDITYATDGENSTIGTAGCGPTVMAMVLSTWCDSSVTPATEAAWALSHGYKVFNQGTKYSYFEASAKRYNLTCKQLNYSSIYHLPDNNIHDQVKDAMNNGCLAIACMGKGKWATTGHFVLVYKIEDDTVYINDPASSDLLRTAVNYTDFKNDVKHYFLINPLKI